MARTGLLLSLALGLFSMGCKKVEAAPADLDGLLHKLFADLDGSDDEETNVSIAALAEVVQADALVSEEVGPSDGDITRLSVDEAALWGVTDRDPALARGIYLVNVFDCTMPQLEKVLVALNQDELYTGVYDDYTRVYTTDEAAFADRDVATLGWTVDIDAGILGSKYSERLNGGVRVLPDEGLGEVFIARAVMPEPAVFESGNKRFDQDFQLEMFWEHSPGKIVHVYGMWREMFLGTGLSTEDDSVARVILNNMFDWDDGTVQLCAEGRP